MRLALPILNDTMHNYCFWKTESTYPPLSTWSGPGRFFYNYFRWVFIQIFQWFCVFLGKMHFSKPNLVDRKLNMKRLLYCMDWGQHIRFWARRNLEPTLMYVLSSQLYRFKPTPPKRLSRFRLSNVFYLKYCLIHIYEPVWYSVLDQFGQTVFLLLEHEGGLHPFSICCLGLSSAPRTLWGLNWCSWHDWRFIPSLQLNHVGMLCESFRFCFYRSFDIWLSSRFENIFWNTVGVNLRRNMSNHMTRVTRLVNLNIVLCIFHRVRLKNASQRSPSPTTDHPISLQSWPRTFLKPMSGACQWWMPSLLQYLRDLPK